MNVYTRPDTELAHQCQLSMLIVRVHMDVLNLRSPAQTGRYNVDDLTQSLSVYLHVLSTVNQMVT